MAFGDMRRMKKLARVVYALAPELGPRIDALPPAPGFPSRAVVLDAYLGSEALAGVRMLVWPDGPKWHAMTLMYEPDTLDVFKVIPVHGYANEASAARWTFSWVATTLEAHKQGALDTFGVESESELNASDAAAYGALDDRHARMLFISRS